MYTKICEKCGMNFETKKSIQRFCSKSCANSFNTTRRKIQDENIFSKGLNNINSYILGLIYSDGCLSYCNHSKRYKITISINDKDLMTKIRNIMTPNNKLYEYKHPNGKDNTYAVVSTNEKDIEFIRKIGVTERKSKTIKFPVMDKKFYSHFIRGVFDGDGSVYVNTTVTKHKGIKKEYSYLNVSFTSGSKDFSKELINVLKANSIDANLNMDSRNNDTSYVKIFKSSSVEKLFHYMYKDANIYMERKYEKFIKMI